MEEYERNQPGAKTMITNLKKANTQRVTSEYTRVTGRPADDRQFMVAVLEGRRAGNNPDNHTSVDTRRIGEVLANRKLVESMRKLNDSQVRSMRLGRQSGVSYKELGEIFNTSAKRTADICNFRAYKDVR